MKQPKKIAAWSAALFAAPFVALLSACVSSGTIAVDSIGSVPDFFLNPPQSETQLFGVGSANMPRIEASRKTAYERAQEDIAFQVEVQVQAALADYARESGAGHEDQHLAFFQTAARQISAWSMHDTKTEKVAAAPDGTIYVLLSADRNLVIQAAQQVFFRIEGAAFDGFKAQEAVASLENRLGLSR